MQNLETGEGMNMAYKLMCNRDISKDELKYLLFMSLSELSWATIEESVGQFDEKECFNINDMLECLSNQLQGATYES